eukprot:4821852-Pleurochrysis_carterae.AAC.1
MKWIKFHARGDDGACRPALGAQVASAMHHSGAFRDSCSGGQSHAESPFLAKPPLVMNAQSIDPIGKSCFDSSRERESQKFLPLKSVKLATVYLATWTKSVTHIHAACRGGRVSNHSERTVRSNWRGCRRRGSLS